MRIAGFAVSVATAAATIVSPAVALSQAGVTSVLENRFQAEAPPAEAEVEHIVRELPPGTAGTPPVFPGPMYVTVLEGAITRQVGGVDRTFSAGEGWVARGDEPVMNRNETARPARFVATIVQPKGTLLPPQAETDATGASTTSPSTFSEQRFEAPGLPASMDVVHRVLELAPGARRPLQSHPGLTVVTVLQGRGSLVEDGQARALSPGEGWTEPAGAVHGGTLTASAPVRLLMAHLIPRGAPHTVFVGGPAPVQVPPTR